MGDDLGDEWWVHGGNSGKSDEEVKKKPQGKRKPEEEEEPVKQQRPVKKRKNDEEEEEEPVKQQTAVKKKKNDEEEEEPVKPVKQQTPVKKRKNDEEEEEEPVKQQTPVKKRKNDAQKEPVKEKKKNTVTQKKSKQVIKQDKDAGQVEGSKKRKRKKKTITDVLASSEVKAGVPEDLQKVLQAHLSSTRSVIEQEELVLQDSSFLTCNDLTHTLSSYMKQVCPKWAKVQKRHTVKQSLVILIACSSALRALELMKQLVAFKGEAKILKLFARHIKVEKQIQLLSNIVAHIGVGTPARITELIQKDGLSLEAVKYLILDWNWRDQKCRRMVDVPEVKVEMFKLLESGILPRCRDGDTKIGLF